MQIVCLKNILLNDVIINKKFLGNYLVYLFVKVTT